MKVLSPFSNMVVRYMYTASAISFPGKIMESIPWLLWEEGYK
jgi:hypothetical protein